MFDFVRKHTRLFQFLLLILILPSFVLLGVEGYSRFMDGSNAGVATVDGRKITQAEWDAAHRQRVDQIRQQMPNVDPKLLDAPELRQESLDQLLRERVLQSAAKEQFLTISKERLQTLFRNDPQFAFLRNPDGSVNKAVLAAQGMSSEMFAQRLRQDLTLRQVLSVVGDSALPTEASASLAFDALLQQREVQVQRFLAKDFAAKLNPTDAELEAYYKQPAVAQRFQLPESADIEYLVLDIDALRAGVSVNEAELRQYYETNVARYTVAEERRASHILIKAGEGASADEKAKARARAEALLQEARKNPAGFAELARKNSQDEGSAARGGDLDFFGRGAMVKPFEDAAYALKQGEISNVVSSDFGYHIIMLTGVRGGDKRSFDSVRAEIEAELRRQQAAKRYSELAEQFSNMVYEQSDSLKPAADKMGLKIQTATVQRKPAAGATGALSSAKLLEAVFGTDALNNKRNTEAVETGPNQMVSARVVQHRPARVPALADVRNELRTAWVAEQAKALAVKAGEQRLADLRKGGDAAGLGEAQVLSRAKPDPLFNGKLLNDLMRTDASKLPAYAGLDAGADGYVVVRINRVLPRDPAVVDAKRAAQQYAQAWGAAEAQAYYGALKAEHKAKITAPQAALAASAPQP
ncbi:SurA N-terminal domain-containing protein [Pelomonas sp. CA6]|uniref:SurA N-terminal domain-containing protein n=1 Tax=Pelomonas sp. CA6 TaxID=2907999 RepID=UPI001F4C2F49|nr:SurA N-terminal domain-containing protein [Pelomonas sp. CA6]MCH7344091.1 SurA N-terminal domain-containing protein [Pelomonas sp. CA6]